MQTQIIMDMGCMGIDDINFRRSLFNTVLMLVRYTGLLCMIGHYQYVCAFDVTIRPSVSTKEIFSDNINLSTSGNEKSAFVSEVSPGVSIIGRSARSILNLNYRMQNLYNAGGNNKLSTANQLQYNSHNTLYTNRLFLDSHSSISQQNTNNLYQTANDNISNSGNSTTVSTFGMSPYWTPRFGDYANGNLRLNFDTVTTGSNSNNNSNSTLNPITDTVNIAEIVQLNSGNEFKRVKWNLAHNNTESYRDGGDNVKFQNSNASVRTYLNQYFNVFAQGGYSNNSFLSTTNTSKNGVFYTFGGQWKPSSYYSVEVGGGNNSYVTVNISPMQRLTWNTTYRKNSIGLNTGTTWQTALNYRTRQSTWALKHDNDTTTVQDILLQQQRTNAQDPSGNEIVNPVPEQRLINIPTLTNDVIVRKTWNLSSTYNTGKSTIGASAFNEDRVYQLSGNSEKVRGISGSWNWQFASKTSAFLRPLWQQTSGSSITNTKSDRYDLSLGINRTITTRINGMLELRHVNQTSDLTTNDYQENRATASLFMRY